MCFDIDFERARQERAIAREIRQAEKAAEQDVWAIFAELFGEKAQADMQPSAMHAEPEEKPEPAKEPEKAPEKTTKILPFKIRGKVPVKVDDASPYIVAKHLRAAA
jgi:hypothetical protein